MSKSLPDLRTDYSSSPFSLEDANKDPIAQFEAWFEDALNANFITPNAMVLSTVSKENRVTSRVVLLKGVDSTGFVFYSNYNSKKGIELSANPNASLLFYWDKLHRQVRIEGSVQKVSPQESDEYFNSRPSGSRKSAIVSPQSEVIQNKADLLARMNSLEDVQLTRPEHWGGYRLEPDYLEFWQGRPDRMHDRIAYVKKAGSWLKNLLAP